MVKSTKMTITYAIATAVLGLALSSSYITGALAASPHFISASCSQPNTQGQITCTFKEAGLGNNQQITYVLSASATAVYACINGGGQHPQATNKETVSGPVSATGTFSSGKNGAVTGSLTLSPPPAGSFSCPPGQKLVLASVSYNSVVITDTTNGVPQSIPGTFARTFFAI